MSHCCVNYCSNNWRYKAKYSAETGKKLHFHHFPDDPLRRKEWIDALKGRICRDESDAYQVTKSSFVCSAHFTKEDYITKAYTKRQVLRTTAKPSVFVEKCQKALRKVPASTTNSAKCPNSPSNITQQSTAPKSVTLAECSAAETGVNNLNVMALSPTETDLQDDSFELEDDKLGRTHGSDEDTEDASEGETDKKEKEFTGIKEQMYQDKLAQLKRQVQQLKEGNLPIYMKKLKKLEQQYKERMRMHNIWVIHETAVIQEEYKHEKEAANKEFEDKKIEMKASLIQELEHKKKLIENERNTMELTGDTMTVKPVVTRKLRRRPNDPPPVPEKRGKPSPIQFTYYIDDQDILADFVIINKVCGGKSPFSKSSPAQGSQLTMSTIVDSVHEASIEDGRLCYDKRWFTRDQAVMIETKEHGKFNATIVNIGSDDVSVKKTSDGSKIRISVSQLQKGYYTVRKKP